MAVVDNKVVEFFQENGYAVIPNFLTTEEVQELKQATKEIIRDYCQNSPISVFGNQSRDTYFAESGDKIRGFFEEQAVDKDGNLKTEKPEAALNKIGHALHKFHPIFHSKTFSPKVKEVVQKLTKINEPTVIQSMVIFKHPRIGGGVKPHQDASYLYTDPTEGKLIGFWIALDKSNENLQNGVLYFVPGSHKNSKLYQRFIRNPDKSSNTLFINEGESVPNPPLESIIPAPVEPGDLVLIDGLVIHQSEPNTSDKPRLAYTFHVVDGSINYSSENWLQPTSKNTFMKLLEN